MQIHEITKAQLQEGLLGDIGRGFVSAVGGPEIPRDAEAMARQAAEKLIKQGYGPGGAARPSADWTQRLAQIKKDPSMDSYINSIVQGWSREQQQAQQQLKQQTLAGQATTPPNAPPPPGGASATATKPATKETEPVYSMGGKRLDPKNPNDAKVIEKLKQSGNLQEAPINLQKNLQTGRTQRTAQRNPAPTTGQMSITTPADTYKSQFLAFTDGQLATRDSAYNAITMKDVRANVKGIGPVLDRALNDVVKARGTNQAEAAIKNYLEIAIAGVQARSQELKNKMSQSSLAATNAAQAVSGTVDQSMAQSGVNINALKAFAKTLKSGQARDTGNPELNAMLQRMGVRVS